MMKSSNAIIIGMLIVVLLPTIHAQTVSPANLENAKNLLAANGIPLSLFNNEKFETDITHVEGYAFFLNHKYNGIPIYAVQIFEVPNGYMPSSIISHLFDKDNPQGIFYFFPEELKTALLEKGINKSAVFVDFASLPSTPAVSQIQATNKAWQIINGWYLEDQNLQIVKNNFNIELKYWAKEATKGNFTLAWVVKFGTSWTPSIIISAQTGDVLYKFDPFPESLLAKQNQIGAAQQLMERNRIPISVLNFGDFTTDIVKVQIQEFDKSIYPESLYSSSTHVSLQNAYKGIPIDGTRILHFNDDKINSYVSGGFIFPQDQASLIQGKGIDESLVLIDFTHLPTTPTIAKEQAESIARSNPSFRQDFSSDYDAHLEYYTKDANKPDELTLAWAVQVRGTQAKIVIDAQTGEVLSAFNGIMTETAGSALNGGNNLTNDIIILIILVVAAAAILGIKRKRAKANYSNGQNYLEYYCFVLAIC